MCSKGFPKLLKYLLHCYHAKVSVIDKFLIGHFLCVIFLSLTPCDGYVSQPQSPVIVVVSSRFTAKKEQNNRDKWWTLNDLFFPSSHIHLVLHHHPWCALAARQSHTHTPVWQVWLMRRDGRHGNSEPGVTACDVTLTCFNLGAGTSAVQAQNRTGNKTFIVKCAVWNKRAPQVQMTVTEIPNMGRIQD